MNPRDWMRLVVPGLFVGLLPACANTPKTSGRLPGYSSGQPGLMSSDRIGLTTPMVSPRSFSSAPESRFATGLPAPVFRTGPAWTPYGAINYPLDRAYETSRLELAKRTPLPIRPQQLPEPAGDESSTPPRDPLLDLVTRNSAGEQVTIVPPLSLPEAITSEEEPVAKTPPAAAEDPPLLHAVRCYLEKRPDDFRDALKSLDAAQRDLLQSLIPLLVRVSEGGLAKIDGREAAVTVDQLQAMLWVLRPYAALVMDKFCFCQQINGFGKIKPLEARPVFRPGDMVEVYAEIRNVSSQLRRSETADFRTHLRSRLEIRASGGEVVNFFNCGKPDQTLTPQHDYYQHYRFKIPDTRPGDYTLNLEVTDVPTGRKVKQKLEFQISQ